MAESSDSLDAMARKSLTTLLQAVERVGQNTVAEGCGVDAATITRDKAAYWPRFTKTIVIAGLKVVPASSRCYAPETIEPLLVLAKQRMAQLDSIHQLEWEDQ